MSRMSTLLRLRRGGQRGEGEFDFLSSISALALSTRPLSTSHSTLVEAGSVLSRIWRSQFAGTSTSGSGRSWTSTRRAFASSMHIQDAASELSDGEVEALVQEYELHRSETMSRKIKLVDASFGPQPLPRVLDCSASGHYLGSELYFEALGRSDQFAAAPKRFQKNSVVVTLREACLEEISSKDPARHGLTRGLPSFLIAYRFGVCVLFNVATEDKDALLQLCSRFTSDPNMDESAREDISIRVLPPTVFTDATPLFPPGTEPLGTPSAAASTSTPSSSSSPPLPPPAASHVVLSASGLPHHPSHLGGGAAEGMEVEALDESTARVIGTVLAQSVALEHYARQVDRNLNDFSNINKYTAQMGRLPASISDGPALPSPSRDPPSLLFTLLRGRLSSGRMTKRELLRKIAETNLLLTDVLLKIKILDRMTDLAWKNQQYGAYWEFLKQDLEMAERAQTLMQKVALIQDDVKFLLEILAQEKSERLEKIIIFLISVEIAVSLASHGFTYWG